MVVGRRMASHDGLKSEGVIRLVIVCLEMNASYQNSYIPIGDKMPCFNSQLMWEAI